MATAEDHVGEAVKQGAGLVGFWAGAKLGGVGGGFLCGPPCAVVGGLAGGILGAMAAEDYAEKRYHAIKG